jgi:hypothetical protein
MKHLLFVENINLFQQNPDSEKRKVENSLEPEKIKLSKNTSPKTLYQEGLLRINDLF